MARRRYIRVSSQTRHGVWDRVKQHDLVLASVTLIMMALIHSASVAADEAYEGFNEIGAGSLVTKVAGGYQALLRMESDINISVNGLLVHAQIEQRFKNDSQDWLEATYVFPLPDESAVDSMTIRVGERDIVGKIKERQQARGIFVKAKQQGKQAGLLEQQRPNLFTTRVANIGPGELIEVNFTYLQTLAYRDGEFSLRVPLTLTPRYIPGNDDPSVTSDQMPLASLSVRPVMGWAFATDQVPDAAEITPPQTTTSLQSKTHVARLNLLINPGFDIAEVNSPYHDIRTQRESAAYRISPIRNPMVMNRDFVVSWRPVPQQAPTAAAFSETVLVDDVANRDSSGMQALGHGLVMVMPPNVPTSAVVPPRELIIIIDTSGSMAGASIVQAKKAVLMALERLRPVDRFNVVEFNASHRALFLQSRPANNAAIMQAKQFVGLLQANGGTEMYGALEAAFNFPESETHLRQVVFMTDGSVGHETALFELIHQRLNNSRLYTVGIGSAPNEFFMRKSAQFGKGTFTLIGSEREVQQKMAQLFRKIEKPLMTQVQVIAEGGKGEFFPKDIPDLYQGEPLVVNAKFTQWPDAVLVQGVYNGQHWQQRLKLADTGQAHGVATLWARQKVQSLEDEGIQQGQRGLYKDAITELGLAYALVTRFTSFVAVAREPVRPVTAGLKSKALANLMPAGSTQQPPSVGMPKTALGVQQQLLLGVICLVAALIIYYLKYRCHSSAIKFTFGRGR